MNQDRTPKPDSEMTIAALLRCAADGELTPEQEARLCAHLDESPGCSQRIEFEQKLREACCDCYSDDQACPDSLRSKVAGMCREACSEGTPAVVGSSTTRERGFWAGSLFRGLAVAAVLILAVTLAFQVGQRSAPGGAVQSEAQVQLAARATEFVTNEHLRCDESRKSDLSYKFTTTKPEDLPAAFEQVMGKKLTLEDLVAHAESIRFVDAGRCGVPGKGRSLHVRLSLPTEGGPHFASLFVQEDQGDLGLSEGKSYHLAGGNEMDKPCVFVWKNTGMIFWLVCERADASNVREAVGAPAVAPGSI